MIHGVDPEVPDCKRGFYTTRHAFAATQDDAIRKLAAMLEVEFTRGVSSGFWRSKAPVLTFEDARRIGLHQLFAAPHKGSTFYDERE